MGWVASRSNFCGPAPISRGDDAHLEIDQGAATSRCTAPVGVVYRQHAGKGSHRILSKPGNQNFPFSFHDGEEIGPRMLAKIAKRTGLKPEDL